MIISALLFAAKTKQIDVFGPILKQLVPILILVVIIRVAIEVLPLFMQKKRRCSQQPKETNGSRSIPSHKLIPCPDCNGLISPKASVCPHCGAPIDANYAREIEDKRKTARRIERESNFMVKMTMTGILGLIVFIGAIKFGIGLRYRWLGICIGLFMIVLPIIRIYVFFNKGKIGELLVRSRLRKGLPDGEYEILNNIYLPIGDGETTQIDHVVVSRFGVFVVETKNYSGWIFADASSKVWTQTIYRTKNTFQNPIFQNYRHVCAIAENLGLPKEFIRSVVAFTGDCEFKTPMPEGVVYSRSLVDYIKSFTSPILKEHDKEEILEALREWNSSVTSEQRASHIDNLRRRHHICNQVSDGQVDHTIES